jgi:phosphoribosyl 1,2-cyclic phosphate phosphodiesterase
VKLTFLGTGTSFGVPVVGCDCQTCRSKDPRDRRTRHGALLKVDGGRLLVDTPPELRLQLLAARVDGIEAVWYTHMHADHVHGIDDLRVFTARSRRNLPVYTPQGTEELLLRRFPYIFDESIRPPRGTTKPEVRLHTLRSDEPVDILGQRFVPLPVPHGPMTVFGFRVGGLAYVTDAKTFPEEVLGAVEGVKVLVLNALWFGNPHPTHFNVEEAAAMAARVGAERTYLTHLTHRVGHQELMDWLPEHVQPAYDGLTVEIDE